MSKPWLIPVLLAAIVGSGATAMGFLLGSSTGETPSATLPEDGPPVACEPVACEPVDCAPVACEPIDCAPVACVEEPPRRRSRRRRRPGNTDKVLNPWEDYPPNLDGTPPEPTPPENPTPPAPAAMREPTKALDPWN